MPNPTVDYILRDALMHQHNSGDIIDLTTTLDPRYLKLSGSLAEVTNHSHTVLTDIGTNTHAQIDTFIGTTVPTTYLKLDQTTPQITTGTFTFPIVHTPTINGGILANDDITIQGTTHSTRTSSYVLLQPNGGNVGIGTTSPGAKLDIYGVYDVDSLRVTRASQTNQYLGFQAGGGLATFNNVEGTNSVYPSYYFNQTKGSTSRTPLIIDGSGYVGIGTTSPSALLTLGKATGTTGILAFNGTTSGTVNLSVADAAGSWTMKLPTTAGTDGYFLKTDGNGNTSWAAAGAGSQTPWASNINAAGYTLNGNSTASGNLTLDSTSNATKGYVLINPSGGNVGIGTASPGGVLDVQQNNSGELLSRVWNTGTGSAAFRFVAADSSESKFQVTHATTWTAEMVGNNNTGNQNNNYLAFRVRGASDANTEAGLDAATRMTILGGGNVGIGTTTPTNILSLGGNSARTFWMERHTTANTAGNTLTITAGGAKSGSTDKAGGALILQGGLSTGSAESGVTIQGCVAGASGTTDRTQTTGIQVLGNKLGFYAGTPIIRQSFIAYTADNESSAYAGIDNLQVGAVYAQLTDLNALRVAYENLRVAYEDLKTKLVATTLVVSA